MHKFDVRGVTAKLGYRKNKIAAEGTTVQDALPAIKTFAEQLANRWGMAVEVLHRGKCVEFIWPSK